MAANRIIQHIFQQPDLQQVSTGDLEQLVAQYPYFAAARLLLARKNYDQQHDLHAPDVKKAQLYSHQPYYFYRFLTGGPQQETAAQVTAPAPEAPAAEAPIAEAPVAETPEEATVTAALPEEAVTPEAAAEETAAETAEEQAPVILAVAQPDESEPEAPAPVNGASADIQETAAPIKIFPLELPAEEETTLTFQPLYTEDYFTYKKLKEPERADELNEQGMAEMKSFTDWLRDMKSSFAAQASKDWYHQQMHRSYEDEDPEVSETVEKMAMESITLNDDIVSETLAEIWARQHQYQTAIQIYQKLSLLNPNKSAYFAQKIQELQLHLQSDKN